MRVRKMMLILIQGKMREAKRNERTKTHIKFFNENK